MIKLSSCSALKRTLRTYPPSGSSNSSWTRSSVKPTTTFKGERISWLIIDKNSLFARLFFSALSRATSNSSVRSWMRRSKSSLSSFNAVLSANNSRLLCSVIRSASLRAWRSRS